MNIWFADAQYYIALLNAGDESHDRARELAARLRGRFVTTQWVLTEVGGAFARSDHRRAFVGLVNTLASKRNVTIVEASGSLFARGLERYAQRLDKAWSMTDCMSFLVMEDGGIREALTADHHFEQAGFVAMLK